MAAAATNEAERRRWNDEYWASVWPSREQLTDAVTDVLLGHLDLAAGQRVLDVGSGGGGTALAVARRVGPAGSVVGADISRPLVHYATRRAEEQGVANVRFVVADAQSESIDGAPFDAAASQFGVMFFEEPTTAFANIRAHTVPGGGLAFACWQPADRNPWHAGHAVGRFLEPPPQPAQGKSPTGPFSLGDATRTAEVVAAAGWAGVERTPYELPVTVEQEAIAIDDAQLAFMGVPDSQLDEARRAVEHHVAGLRRDDGRCDVVLAFQVFTATA
ncbi:MAG: class I SAM-dependent methyltransferase [Actinomycetota bacterium]|nr:class I SAM-dependent methyltransferase [Actinomycetota bacterium]